jgi:hypothetical protein
MDEPHTFVARGSLLDLECWISKKLIDPAASKEAAPSIR